MALAWARVISASGHQHGVGLIPVRFGDLWCAFEALAVEEILGATRWIRLPGSTTHLPGVLGWRGRAVAVLDLGVMAGLGDPADPDRAQGRTIVVSARDCTFAIPVDAAREVVEVARHDVRAPVATRQRFSSMEVELEEGVVVPVFELGAVMDAVRPPPAGDAS